MTDKERFAGFAQSLIAENEAKYGTEIREKYGDATINASNKKLQDMTQDKFNKMEALTQDLNQALKAAVSTADPTGEAAQYACELHKNWLCQYWSSYTKAAHLGLGEMYVNDPRFTAHYEAIAPGCAQFLYDALKIYCQ